MRAAGGLRMGRIEPNGTVRAANGRRLGIVEPDGTVRDAYRRRIGSAEYVRPKWVAAYFFFFCF